MLREPSGVTWGSLPESVPAGAITRMAGSLTWLFQYSLSWAAARKTLSKGSMVPAFGATHGGQRTTRSRKPIPVELQTALGHDGYGVLDLEHKECVLEVIVGGSTVLKLLSGWRM